MAQLTHLFFTKTLRNYSRLRCRDSGLLDFVGVKQHEALCSLIEVIAKQHAVLLFLNLNNLLTFGNS